MRCRCPTYPLTSVVILNGLNGAEGSDQALPRVGMRNRTRRGIPALRSAESIRWKPGFQCYRDLIRFSLRRKSRFHHHSSKPLLVCSILLSFACHGTYSNHNTFNTYGESSLSFWRIKVRAPKNISYGSALPLLDRLYSGRLIHSALRMLQSK